MLSGGLDEEGGRKGMPASGARARAGASEGGLGEPEEGGALSRRTSSPILDPTTHGCVWYLIGDSGDQG